MEVGQEFEAQSEKMEQGTNKIKESIKKMIKVVKKFLKSVFKIVKQIVQWIVSALGGSGIYILIALVILVIVISVAGFVMYLFSGGYDPSGGLISSIGGVKGDKFYGTRFLYYDEEVTTNELEDIYLDFTYNIVSDVNSTYKINIDYTKPYYNNQQIESFTLAFAKEISSGTTLVECVKNTNHYGFDDVNKNENNKTEKDIVLETLANTIVSGGYAESTVTTDMMLSAIKTSFDNDYSYMKNVCAKVLIKDYILSDSNDVASDIKKKNYFGFVYMPKTDVIIKSASLIYAVDESKTVDIVANYSNGTEITKVAEKTADSTWFKGGMADKSFDCVFDDYIINKFTAIDTNNIDYLKEEKSLFQIIKDGKFDIYFKEGIDKNNTSELLKNFNTNSNYVYLEMSANSSFNMAEAIVEYKGLE